MSRSKHSTRPKYLEIARWPVITLVVLVATVPALYGFYSLCHDINVAVGIAEKHAGFFSLFQMLGLLVFAMFYGVDKWGGP